MPHGLVATSGLDHLDQVDFIYKVGPFSFIVALLAGAAGMMALNSAKSAALVGVFIGDDGAGRGFRVRRAHRGPVRPSRAVRAATRGQLAGIVVAAVVVLVVSRPAAAGHEGCAHSLPGSRRWRHGDGHGLLCTVRRDTAVNRGWRGRVLTRREHRPRVGRRVEEHQYIVARAQCGVRAYPQR